MKNLKSINIRGNIVEQSIRKKYVIQEGNHNRYLEKFYNSSKK